ncbi:hypothetical protein SAMN06269117_1187 [Balnearium lithotrophicum]|uniref:BFD-like [2Fe-2S] binding domain-containing protein n=1 Tax=Balnearium lithotrophicum TaxID=223788 RepID=A0A521D840_9BACT|nr:BFD-like (2Fe-2S) protein [Balnearium lithotrophicum]SMO67868.1 hypothetical protein SAMN06269117_1187 [Balnearium lithotrophicum]
MAGLVYYYFGCTDEDIKNDVLKHRGISTIASKIVGMKKEGLCQCEVKHPEGR